ncbi:MAG: hypothetical protein IH611_07420 [Deltaproteobacteria bacterium]|nr:hypothetical protein [Deltaproteobacteria bacterium]
MPIYEYICKKCGSISERIHGMNENPSVKCGSCGGKSERKISSGAFVLKGSGFYVNDYGKKSKMPEGCPAAAGKADGAPACPACPGKMSKKPLPKLSTDPS